MSKPAAFLLALVLGASACSTAESEQSIVAVAEPAADSNRSSGAEATDTQTPSTEAPVTQVPVDEVPVETTVAPTEPKTETAVEDLLAFTVDPDAQHASARFKGGISMNGDVEGETIDFEMNLNGAYNLNDKSMELSLDMSDMAAVLGDVDDADAEMFQDLFSDPMQMKAIDDTAWLKWGLLDMFSGSQGSWIEMEAEENMFGSGASTPTDLVEMFKGASGHVTDLGTESINGVDTTHFQILMDLEEYADNLSAAEADEIREMVGDLGDMPLDVWIDDDGLLRRLEMSMSPEAFGAVGMSAGDDFEMSVWYEVFDYGSDIEITPPPADEVISGSDIGTF
jgi:hypothetical protein